MLSFFLLVIFMQNIEVKYTPSGQYSVCSGRLVIRENGEIIYDKSGVTSSTGSVWFDENWSEHVESGELIWTDTEASDKFSGLINRKVKEKLSEFSVCCGGCV